MKMKDTIEVAVYAAAFAAARAVGCTPEEAVNEGKDAVLVHRSGVRILTAREGATAAPSVPDTCRATAEPLSRLSRYD